MFALDPREFLIRTGIEKELLVFVSGILGVVAMFFLIKPVFARRDKTPAPLFISPGSEPALEAFVFKIADAVGASRPKAIEVDCNVNAAAGFRRGFWSLFTNDLKLVVGLPLAGAMDLRSLGGVLAHEFGHFAQGTGLRLTYLIRSVNAWFARVVYERDAWDARLEQLSRGIDIRLMIVLMAMRLLIWLSRRVLWVLMHIGHGISCFAMRQMEYDADFYEAQFAGSGDFAKTSRQLRMTSIGSERALHLVAETWEHQGLARDLPRLTLARTKNIPPDLADAVDKVTAEQKTGIFDTHPSDPDRIAHSEALKFPGIFTLEEPATALFKDFDALSQRATHHFYDITLGLPVTGENLIDNEVIEGDDDERQEALKALDRYLFECFSPFHPFFITPAELSCAPDVTEEDLVRLEAELKAESDKHRSDEKHKDTEPEKRPEESKGTNEKLTKAVEKLDKARCAMELIHAGFKIKGAVFGLPGGNISDVIAAENAAQKRIGQHAKTLGKFDALAKRRIIAGLEARRENSAGVGLDPEVEKLVGVLAFFQGTFPDLVNLRRLIIGQEILLNQLGSENSEAHVDRLRSNGNEMEGPLKKITAAADGLRYPFKHHKRSLTIPQLIAVEHDDSADAIFKQYNSAEKCVNQLYSLYVRTVGRLCQLAEKATPETTQTETSAGSKNFSAN